MIAELKKTQVIPQVVDYVARELSQVSRPRSGAQSRNNHKTGIWLTLPQESAGESLVHGIVIGAAAASIVYGLAISVDLAVSWSNISQWLMALIA